MHTHPSYIGVVQSFSLTEEEIIIGRHVAIMHGCFVTSFMIEDLAARFVQAGEYIKTLPEFDYSVYRSVIDAGRQ